MTATTQQAGNGKNGLNRLHQQLFPFDLDVLVLVGDASHFRIDDAKHFIIRENLKTLWNFGLLKFEKQMLDGQARWSCYLTLDGLAEYREIRDGKRNH